MFGNVPSVQICSSGVVVFVVVVFVVVVVVVAVVNGQSQVALSLLAQPRRCSSVLPMQ